MELNNIIDIIDTINKDVGVEKIKSKLSPLDSFIIIRDLLNKDSKILNILSKNKNIEDKEFNFIYNTIVNKSYNKLIIIGNNHYDNPFLNINFILGNPYLFNLEIFEILYNRRNELKEIPEMIENCWHRILNSDLKKFFNAKLIKTSEFKFLTKEDILKVPTNTEETYLKYIEIYKIFDEMNCKTKKIIFNLKDHIKTNQNPGCYNLNKTEYLWFARIHTGLTLNYNKLNILLRWAKRELDKLVDEMKIIIKRVRPDLFNMHISDIIKYLQNDPIYKYKTKEDFVNHHKEIMHKMHDFFINEKKIKEFKIPNLTIIDDPNLGGAYWAFDTFYLNVTSWDKINDYQALPLTLHEAVPGHHTQVSYSVHDDTDGYDVLYSWFGMTSGFHEGWALFTEKLAPSYTEMEKIGQLQYEMLRTIRVIVDISIHAGGISPDEIIQFMEKYLAMPHASIESEVYRYVTIPGQALGYKLGATIFRKIHQKVVGEKDLLSDKSFELYKKIIYEKAKPLEILMQNYDLTFEEVFI